MLVRSDDPLASDGFLKTKPRNLLADLSFWLELTVRIVPENEKRLRKRLPVRVSR